MTGLLYAMALLAAGFAGLFGVIWLVSPKALRATPHRRNDPHILGSDMQSGRGGYASIRTIPSDSRDYSKIWSNDRK